MDEKTLYQLLSDLKGLEVFVPQWTEYYKNQIEETEIEPYS